MTHATMLSTLDRGPEGAIATMTAERFADDDARTRERLDELIASGKGNLDRAERARTHGVIQEDPPPKVYRLTGGVCRCGCGQLIRRGSKTGVSAYCPKRSAISERLRRGWSVERAVSTPIGPQGRRK